MPTPHPTTAYTLYPEKSKRVQGILSKDGGVLFERVRATLRRATGRHRISDADVIDFATRAAARGSDDAFADLVTRDVSTTAKSVSAAHFIAAARR